MAEKAKIDPMGDIQVVTTNPNDKKTAIQFSNKEAWIKTGSIGDFHFPVEKKYFVHATEDEKNEIEGDTWPFLFRRKINLSSTNDHNIAKVYVKGISGMSLGAAIAHIRKSFNIRPLLVGEVKEAETGRSWKAAWMFLKRDEAQALIKLSTKENSKKDRKNSRFNFRYMV